MEWVKAGHVIAVIAWMAGMFYLPRLFVYHTTAPVGSEQSETFKVMERRLLRAIMTPAMLAAWAFGLWMISAGVVDWSAGWPYLKAVAVLVMTACHGVLARHTKQFAQDRNTRPEKYFRLINEVPTVLMMVIVVAVIARPF